MVSRFHHIIRSLKNIKHNSFIVFFYKNLNREGEITLEDVRNHDFEDIALSSSTKYGDELIFVGDIGNDWPNHCQGVNQTKRMVHVFSEPDLNEYR